MRYTKSKACPVEKRELDIRILVHFGLKLEFRNIY